MLKTWAKTVRSPAPPDGAARGRAGRHRGHQRQDRVEPAQQGGRHLHPEGSGRGSLTGTDKLPGGDLNGDNVVNTLDYSILRYHWK